MFGKKNIYFSIPLIAIAALGLARAAGNAATAGDISVAQVLNTSPLYADSGSYHQCNVVNVTTATITVSIELISGSGTVVNAENSTSVPAGSMAAIGDDSASGSSSPGFGRCRFSTNYGPGVIRANETIFAILPSGNIQTYAVSEAR